MITTEQSLKIDPTLANFSREELEEILRSLHDSAQLAFEVYWERKYGSKYPVGSFTGSTAKE
ncbi:MAG: hypothetical protein WAX80_02230 [Minisyncoccia bacterium]